MGLMTSDNCKPFFKNRYWNVDDMGASVITLSAGTGFSSTAYRRGFFNYEFQPNSNTGKIIKGDFCFVPVGKGDINAVQTSAQAYAMVFPISVELQVHSLLDGGWYDRGNIEILGNGNGKNTGIIKIATYFNTSGYNATETRYGRCVHIGSNSGSLLTGAPNLTTKAAYTSAGYYGSYFYSGYPCWVPEPIGYRYHSNCGDWSPDRAHVLGNRSSSSAATGFNGAQSAATKSIVDGGGGEPLTYRFFLNDTNGVGMDKFRLVFKVQEGENTTHTYVTSDYPIDNPLLSIPDYQNRTAAQGYQNDWPPRYDAMSYVKGGSWSKKIPLFFVKKSDGDWGCF